MVVSIGWWTKSSHRKLLFHQTSILNWLFGVPGIYHRLNDATSTEPWTDLKNFPSEKSDGKSQVFLSTSTYLSTLMMIIRQADFFGVEISVRLKIVGRSGPIDTPWMPPKHTASPPPKKTSGFQFERICSCTFLGTTLRLLTPPMETPDPPSDNQKGAAKQVATWHQKWHPKDP